MNFANTIRHLGRTSELRFLLFLAALGMLAGEFSVAVSQPPPASKPPPSQRIAVSDTYHGVVVTEDYRWLEDASDPKVGAWSASQNAYARAVLDKLPDVEAVRTRVTQILAAKTVKYWGVRSRAGKFFSIKRQPPKQQPFLVVTNSVDNLATERILVDPNVLDPTGSTAIDWYEPSLDGKLVALSLSKGGTEAGDAHIYETSTGRQVDEIVPRVNTGTAGGDLAWAPDGSGFYYTRHPRPGERASEDMNFYQQLFFHKLGTPTDEDRYELGKGFPRIAEIQLTVDAKSGRVLATVQNGDGGEFAHYLRSPDGQWRQFSRFGDRIIQAEFGPNDDLFIVSLQKAPRGKILHVTIDRLDVANARVVVSEGEQAILSSFWHTTTVVPTDTRLYVVYQLGGPSEIRVFDHQGNRLSAPRQLPISSVGPLHLSRGDDILFRNTSYLEPAAWYVYNAAANETHKTAFAATSPVRLDDAVVLREFATSKDGTQVPVNLLMRQGTRRDGTNPCLATGYGGYGVNITPRFRAINRMLLDHGFVLAIANLRGGGEFGEQWHLEGNLVNKQNVFDDFAGVIQHLVDRRYTSPSKLAILGGSNGGLLMGATLVQHPKMARAVISYVGIYDSLRSELSPNGEFNITEFGTVQDKKQFRALHAYSPYHHVRDNVEYPAVLFLTGENDPRVDPMHSRKMTARLQAANASSAPILLRTSAGSGHGRDTALSEQIGQTVDVYAFLFEQLGIPVESVRQQGNIKPH